jgi:hypothetical protein
MHTVKNDAHTLPGCDECGNTDNKANQGKDPPSTASAADSEDYGSNETSDDAADTQSTSEKDTRTVAVANGPADEVGVSLAA